MTPEEIRLMMQDPRVQRTTTADVLATQAMAAELRAKARRPGKAARSDVLDFACY
jgi:hypothetical protein